jgi:predicted DNA-binding transcriptional regulator AlpA
MDYEFTFVVDGATVDDETVVARLESELDAMLARAGGQNLLTVSYKGDNAVDAALAVAHRVRDHVPDMRLTRLDRDLVGVQEIAERTDRSRQNVYQWTSGSRLTQGTPFPEPEGVVGRARVWLWTEVNAWLNQHGLDDGACCPTRHEMTLIDFFLANGLIFSFRSTPATGFEESRQAVVQELMAHITSFCQFVSGLPPENGTADQRIVAVAGPEEAAHDVMRFIAEARRDVVLVTSLDDETVGVRFSVDRKGPQPVICVGRELTVYEWMKLVRDKPSATFVTEDVVSVEATRIQHRQTRALASAV